MTHFEEKKYKTGLVLSGGGVRGFFHSGLLHAFRERAIEIDIISATSAGAIAASLYGCEINQREVLDRFPTRMRSLFFEPNRLIKAKFNPTSILREYIDEFLDSKTFEDVTIPLVFNAVDISNGETKLFRSGHLIEAVMASCAIPGVFNVFHENGRIYVDGGLTMNLPASIIRADCTTLIGVNLLPFQEREYDKLPGRRHLIQRSVDIYHKHNNRKQIALCDHLISPAKLSKYPTYDTSNKNALFELGYETGMNFRL